MSKDGCVRKVIVAYKIMDEETDTWRHVTVRRPVRECIKLFEIGDTTFADDMKEIRKKADEIISKRQNIEGRSDKHKSFEDILDEFKTQELPISKSKLKRKSELELLKLGCEENDIPRLRPRKDSQHPFISCFTLSEWNSVGLFHDDKVNAVLADQWSQEERDLSDAETMNIKVCDTIENFDEVMFLL